MRFKLLLMLTMCYCASVNGQNRTNKSSLTLAAYHAINESPAGTILPVLVQGDVQQIIAFVQANNGIYKFKAGNIVSAELSIPAIQALNLTGIVKQIDIPTGKIQLLNDVMVKHNNVDSAYYGYWPLEQGYDGTDVIVGVVDAPFDINHGDFKDADGNTRIKYIWDQNLIDGIAPAPYTYGIECDSAMIANGSCPSGDFNQYEYSHGSGVTGVAASSGNAANAYRGVAPNADLVLVSMNFSSDYYTSITDAIAYIYARANELGKPCVINTSLGTYAGSHDGTDLTAQVIDALIIEQNGRALVAAAGNAGHLPFHLGYTVTPTPQFTWFKKLSYTNLTYFQLWADSTDFNAVNFSIGADNPSTWVNIGTSPLYNMVNDFNFDFDIIDSMEYTIPGGGLVKIYAQLLDGKYLLEFVITPDVSTYYWRFTTSGSGNFDIWSTEATTGYSNYVTTGLPGADLLPEIVNYKSPNTDQTIVSSWQCSNNVITVGSYVNRDTMTNYYHVYPPLIDVVGSLFYTSSHGPTRDGRIKPEICAPGARVISTASSTLTNWLIEESAATYMSEDGQHYMYNGTSFSSPAVAGIVALYLQQNPIASNTQIRDALFTQARSDIFTGEALPNNLWGYGKADAFRMLTGSWGCNTDDYLNAPENIVQDAITSSKIKLSWDLIPNAAGYQIWCKAAGSPALKVKATLNTKTISGLIPNTNYTIKVRAFCDGFGFSNWSDTFIATTLPLRTAEAQASLISVFPNPANNNLHIEGVINGGQISLVNTLGDIIFTTVASMETTTINTTTFSSGIYLIMIEENGFITTNKILIAH